MQIRPSEKPVWLAVPMRDATDWLGDYLPNLFPINEANDLQQLLSVIDRGDED